MAVVEPTATDRSQWAISSPLHNKLLEADRPIHGWYRFVLSFPPHLVREYLQAFGASRSSRVLDPFCGTGTTIVECKKNGIASCGIEANNLAAFASKTKVSWIVDTDLLRKSAEAISAQSLNATQSMLRKANGDAQERLDLYDMYALDEEQVAVTISGSISPLPLHRCLSLKRLIALADKSIQDHLQLALAWTIVSRAGNIRFGPEVGITPPKHDVDVELEWLAQVTRMADDLDEYRHLAVIEASVIHSDSRNVSDLPGKFDVVFTSPPYPNEKDYTRTTRLESVILGFIKNRIELRQLKQTLLRSNTRNIYVNDRDSDFVKGISSIQTVARQIEDRRLELCKDSGFEKLYHKVVTSYFGGMAEHLRTLSLHLNSGAKLGYVVGDQASFFQIPVRTGELLAEVAESVGYRCDRIDLFRTRLATATKQQLREEVVILTWPGRK